MRLLVCIAILLLLPLAAAQSVAPPAGTLTVVDAKVPSEIPSGFSAMVKVRLEYSCAGIDGSDDMVLHYVANATLRSDGSQVPTDGSDSILMDSQFCLQTASRVIDAEIEIPFTLGQFDADDVLDLEVTAWTEAGDGPTYRSSDEVRADYSAPVIVPPAEEEVAVQVVEDGVVQEKFVPGISPAWLIAGLAAIVLRRQR